MRSKGKDGNELDMCSEWRGTMTVRWRWSGNQKEKGKGDGQRSYGKGQ